MAFHSQGKKGTERRCSVYQGETPGVCRHPLESWMGPNGKLCGIYLSTPRKGMRGIVDGIPRLTNSLLSTLYGDERG